MIRPGRHRRSIRLRGYDYTRAGAYFITICSRNRSCVFAEIVADVIDLTPIGKIVTACWEAIPEHFATAELDAFVIMPNHLHGIVVLGVGGTESQGTGSEGTACRAPTSGDTTSVERFGAPVVGSIPTIVRSFKAAVTKAINDGPGRGTVCRAFLVDRFGPLPPGRIATLWQSNYHEHVVRNEHALDRLRDYIAANPARWVDDSLHPDNPDAPILGRSRFRRL